MNFLFLQRSRAKSSSLDFPCPANFIAHIDSARLEKERRSGALIDDGSKTLKKFYPAHDPLTTIHYNIYTCDMVDFAANIPRKPYKLAIADIPYGFRLKGSQNDESAYSYKQIDAMVSSLKSMNLAINWTFVIFHSTIQAGSVNKALRDHLHAVESLMW